MRIVINGFGRIGRTVLRQVLKLPETEAIDVVRINDIAPLETCAYLLKYDSVFGPYPGEVKAGPGCLMVDGREIPFFRQGRSRRPRPYRRRRGHGMHRQGGRARDRRTGPRGGCGERADLRPLRGGRHHAGARRQRGKKLGDFRIVSNGSCTTNALAPLLRVLDDTLGIEAGHMTTIHCYTGSQPMVDAPRGPLERSRAGGVSMVPTTTSATRLVGKVLPQLDGKISGAAVRVPAISVSAVDLTLTLARPAGKPVNDMLCEMFAGSRVIGFTEDRVVSTDMRARPESLVVALPETLTVGERQVRIFGWYDNEWGFSARMIDMARLMAAR
ncbi:glyceraldehyde 3-phosphate dehydrogenase NAD-binding domain-containing protein [Roseibium salinum]|nr:glyceraldehyde 3-phosphate dehydrogenase NAD-binding domain-containing protein [Roseibium salinum]